MVTPLGPGPEFDLIRRFLETGGAAADATAVRVGPGDDCAVLHADGLAITVDMAVEDIHFRSDWLTAEEIGYRAAAAAISDLAAMAARPIGVLVSLALPTGRAGEGVDVQRGIAGAARDVGAGVLGGDVVASPGPLVVDIVAVGAAPEPVVRSGARPADELWVTGELGGAAAAVRSWLAGMSPDPVARAAYARPRPRIAEALWLAERGVPTAMIDLSDGLAGDAAHIAAASGVRVVVEAVRIPVAGAAEAAGPAHALELAAAGGEDYELCFAAAPGAVEPRVPEFTARFGLALTRVGRVEEGEGAMVVDGNGQPLPLRGFQHGQGME